MSLHVNNCKLQKDKTYTQRNNHNNFESSLECSSKPKQATTPLKIIRYPSAIQYFSSVTKCLLFTIIYVSHSLCVYFIPSCQCTEYTENSRLPVYQTRLNSRTNTAQCVGIRLFHVRF